MDTPTFSLIIPAYNAADTLERCLDSALEQSVQFTEIIVLDDGSSDDTRLLVGQYQRDYPQVSYHYHENMGAGGTRNKGVRLATADFVAFLDADDTLSPDFVDQISCRLQERSFDIVFFDYHIFEGEDDSGNIVQLNVTMKDRNAAFNSEIQNFLSNTGYMVCVAAYKRDFLLINDIRNGEGSYLDDQEFTVKAILCANSAAYIHQPLYNYILRPLSITTTRTEKSIRLLTSGMLTSSKKITMLANDYTPLETGATYALVNHIFTGISDYYNILGTNFDERRFYINNAQEIFAIIRKTLAKNLTGFFPWLDNYYSTIDTLNEADCELLGPFVLADCLHRHYETHVANANLIRSRDLDEINSLNQQLQQTREYCEDLENTIRDINNSRTYRLSRRMAEIYSKIAIWRKNEE